MDYGFAPGGTKFDVAARKYLDWRPASALVLSFDTTVAAFVDLLKTGGMILRPVNDLAIGCHGNGTGQLEIRLDHASSPTTRFEAVLQVEALGTLKIPSTVLDPRPVIFGVTMPALFRIVGCSIGQARPFLERLKAALGGNVVIVATPHLDVLVDQNIGGIDGVLRFFEYDFFITTPLMPLLTPLPTKGDVVMAFDQKHLKWLDGTPVPHDFWIKRVPVDVLSIGSKADESWLDLIPSVGTMGYLLAPANIWEHLVEPVGPFKVMPPGPIAATPEARREFMRTAIAAHLVFAAAYPWPLHQQLGYESYDAFIDGYDWQPMPGQNNLWSGYRNVYRVHTPVVETPGRYNIFYDFVSANSAAIRLGLSESDTRFFTVV